MKFKFWLAETHWGDELFSAKKIWMLPFKSVQKDQEGWYIDWAKFPGSIPDPNDVSIGDKVADTALNMTPYWEIDHVTDNGRIYLKPIEPNPLITGVGAGGKQIDSHDHAVLTGEYEQKRIDDILAAWRAGQVVDIRDISYLLLGAVPVNFGPNGSQGGWYNANDTRSNRGGHKGMSGEEIVKKDAYTLKHTFGFDVPEDALNGQMTPYDWTRFVAGDADLKHKLPMEKEDPDHMANVVLTHPQPSVKLRAAEWLIDHYMYANHNKKDRDWLGDEDWEQQRDLRLKGHYRKKHLDKLLHDTAIKLANIHHPKTEHDPYYLVKEKFLILAKQLGWKDVFDAYENAKDGDNRRFVFRYHIENRDVNKIKEMLIKEKDGLTLSDMLENAASTYEKPEDFIEKMYTLIFENGDKFLNVSKKSDEWIKEKIENVVNVVRRNMKRYYQK